MHRNGHNKQITKNLTCFHIIIFQYVSSGFTDLTHHEQTNEFLAISMRILCIYVVSIFFVLDSRVCMLYGFKWKKDSPGNSHSNFTWVPVLYLLTVTSKKLYRTMLLNARTEKLKYFDDLQ